jgi:regulator of RNase E activity RraB
MVSTFMNESAIQEDIAAHRERNATLVQHITDRGGDTQRQRTIDCFFHTRTEDDAIALSRLLQSSGLQDLSITPADGDGEHPWTVQGTLKSSVAAFTAAGQVEEFIRVAAKHDALFDGWGTLLDEFSPTN